MSFRPYYFIRFVSLLCLSQICPKGDLVNCHLWHVGLPFLLMFGILRKVFPIRPGGITFFFYTLQCIISNSERKINLIFLSQIQPIFQIIVYLCPPPQSSPPLKSDLPPWPPHILFSSPLPLSTFFSKPIKFSQRELL